MLHALNRLKNSKEFGIIKSGRFFEVAMEHRRKVLSEWSSKNGKGKSIFKHKDTGEKHILSIDDERVLSGEYVGINKGNHMTKPSCVMVRLEDGSVKTITPEEFATGKYVGVNKGKSGGWDYILNTRRSKPWWRRTMFDSLTEIIKVDNAFYFMWSHFYDINDIVEEGIKLFPDIEHNEGERKRPNNSFWFFIKSKLPYISFGIVDKEDQKHRQILNGIKKEWKLGHDLSKDEEFVIALTKYLKEYKEKFLL